MECENQLNRDSCVVLGSPNQTVSDKLLLWVDKSRFPTLQNPHHLILQKVERNITAHIFSLLFGIHNFEKRFFRGEPSHGRLHVNGRNLNQV